MAVTISSPLRVIYLTPLYVTQMCTAKGCTHCIHVLNGEGNKSESHSAFISSKQQHLPFISVAAEGRDGQYTQYTQCGHGKLKCVSNTASTQYTKYTVQVQQAK